MSTSLANQTAAWKTQSEADSNTFGHFVRIDMPGYTLRAFTGGGVIEWDDGSGTQTWTGIPLLDIGSIPGKTGIEAQVVTLSLSGLDSSLKSEVMDYLVRGSEVYIWTFYFSGGSIVADPWLTFAGFVDVPEFEEDESVSLSVECVDAVGRALRRTVAYRTDVNQQELFSGDRFFEFTPQVGRRPLAWGVPWENGGGAGATGGNNGAPTYDTPGLNLY